MNPCNGCRCSGSCPAQNELCRVALFAWVHDEQLPECPFFQELFYHGLEGVRP